MALILLAAFILTPLVEIGVFIEVGDYLGLWLTLALIVATAAGGLALLRHQGLATFARAREALSRHQPPVDEVFDGLCLLVAGALLLTPGFVTDALGFLLLVPAARRLLQGILVTRILAAAEITTVTPGTRDDDGPVIDTDFTDLTNDEEAPEDPAPPRVEPPRE